jgi:hypothetical protein
MIYLPRIMRVHLLLIAVGIVDMFTTLYWVYTGSAIEFNPIMAAVLRVGTWAFIAVKMGTLLAYVSVMEWYRRRRCPAFARAVGHITVFSYLGLYATSFSIVNYSAFLG